MIVINAFGRIGRVLVALAISGIAVASLVPDSRGTLLMIAISVGGTGVALYWVARRVGRVAFLDRSLVASGVPGTASITAISETGVTVNGSPVIAFELDVHAEAHGAYTTTIRQRVPRPILGSFLAGSRVGVVVDPADQDHLAIDWETGVDTAVQTAGGTDVEGQSLAGSVVDGVELLRIGRQATAMITAMEDAGDMSELGLVEVGALGEDDRLMIVSLEVKQAGLSPYDVRVAHRVPERLVGRVGPRTQVEVAVDRDDDRAVAIDWESVRR